MMNAFTDIDYRIQNPRIHMLAYKVNGTDKLESEGDCTSWQNVHFKYSNKRKQKVEHTDDRQNAVLKSSCKEIVDYLLYKQK